jgi:LuxR family maltose regulon positive regulatory protein
MTDMPAAAGSGRAPGRAEPGLIHRHDLMAALNRAAQKRVTIISAPAGTGKTSLLRAWADQPGRDCRIAFMTVRLGQHDMQLFWLTMLGAVRAAAGTGEVGAQLPLVAPGSSGSAMVDKVLSELEESCDRFVLVIDDLHELSSPEAAGQLTALLTRLPSGVRAVVATRRDLPLRLGWTGPGAPHRPTASPASGCWCALPPRSSRWRAATTTVRWRNSPPPGRHRRSWWASTG